MARAIADTKESRSIGRLLAKQNLWIWPTVAALATVSALFVSSFLNNNFLGISLLGVSL